MADSNDLKMKIDTLRDSGAIVTVHCAFGWRIRLGVWLCKLGMRIAGANVYSEEQFNA